MKTFAPAVILMDLRRVRSRRWGRSAARREPTYVLLDLNRTAELSRDGMVGDTETTFAQNGEDLVPPLV